MNTVRTNPLSFTVLDGLAFAAARGLLQGGIPPTTTASDLGPLLELWQLAAGGIIPCPDEGSWLALDGVASLYRELASGRPHWTCPATRSQGYFRTTARSRDDELGWVAFGVAAQRAATSVGFSRSTAQQLVGAIGELTDNIYEHSEAAASGVAAFKATPGAFEFVVFDRGIGVMQSLRACPEHASLSDHGNALSLALTEGVSRFGSDTGRGKGFRPLFVGLANLWGSLRFRSGDHALTVDGQSPTLVTAQTAQKVPLVGFFVSVTCRIKPPQA